MLLLEIKQEYMRVTGLKYYHQKGYTLISVLLVLAITSYGIVKVVGQYNDYRYTQESEHNAYVIIKLAKDISEAVSGSNDCSVVSNEFVAYSNIIPKGWRVDTSSPSSVKLYWGSDNLAEAVISSNLPEHLKPPGWSSYDGFSIKLNKYKINDGPRFISQLVDYFDIIIWGAGNYIKDLQGYHPDIFQKIKENEGERTGMRFIKLGC